MGKGRECHELNDAGVEALKKFWQLSGYSDDSLGQTSDARGSDFFRATGLAAATFKKIAKILTNNDAVQATPSTFLKFAKPLFLAVGQRGSELETNDRSFQQVLEQEIFDASFFKIDNQESLATTISHADIARLLDRLDYRMQVRDFQETIRNSASRAMAFGLPTEDKLIEKWLSRRLRDVVKCYSTQYNSNVEYIANGDWNIEGFCTEVKEQLRLEQSFGQRNPSRKPMNSDDVIDRLKAISMTRTVFMRISGLQEQEYSKFLQDFYQPLRSNNHNVESRIIVLLTQCSECQEFLERRDVDVLDAMDIRREEVNEWLPEVRDKISSISKTIPKTIPDNADAWSTIWKEGDRQERLGELFTTICGAFGNTSLRLRDLETYLTKQG